MRFGVFYEHQLPRPWNPGDEQRLLHEALEQVELADGLGFDYAWETEHHFLEEYSHSAAPEVFLGACTQRTKKIRLGHGITLCPPAYNHPARVAERIATLDLLSGGRVEFGTGASGSRTELEGFAIQPDDRRAMWLEAVEQICNMMVMNPYPGYAGEFFSMPCRNLVPRPLQKPHPPLWLACSNRQTIVEAAKLGMGALTFAFLSPSDAKQWVDEYYRTIRDCVPVGHAINPNIAMVMGFSCHEDAAEAQRRALEGFLFFNYGLAHYYYAGSHQPGRTQLWERFQEALPTLPKEDAKRGMGTPDDLRNELKAYEDAGVDQIIFVQQAGRIKHEHTCHSLELFGKQVMPDFLERAVEWEARKAERLGEDVERAMARKRYMDPLPDELIPTYSPWPRTRINERMASTTGS